MLEFRSLPRDEGGSLPDARNPDITRLLRAWSDGDPEAFDELVPLVYAELRRLARRRLIGERRGGVLATTALVHEAYLRLVDGRPTGWKNRAQFFAFAAHVMRHVLVDAARARQAAKRGGGAAHVALDEAGGLPVVKNQDLAALDDAMKLLATIDPRKEKVVELRYFAGLTVQETASVLGVSVDTVMRDWKMAKLWLLRQLRRGESSAT